MWERGMVWINPAQDRDRWDSLLKCGREAWSGLIWLRIGTGGIPF